MPHRTVRKPNAFPILKSIEQMAPGNYFVLILHSLMIFTLRSVLRRRKHCPHSISKETEALGDCFFTVHLNEDMALILPTQDEEEAVSAEDFLWEVVPHWGING